MTACANVWVYWLGINNSIRTVQCNCKSCNEMASLNLKEPLWPYHYHQSGSSIESVLTSSKRATNYQQANDVPGTSPEGLLKVLRSNISRRPTEDSYRTNTKIDDLMKKVFFKCNGPCFTHLLLFFTEKKNIYSKVLNGDIQWTYTRAICGISQELNDGTF